MTDDQCSKLMKADEADDADEAAKPEGLVQDMAGLLRGEIATKKETD